MIEIPYDILDIIFSNLSIYEKSKTRVVCKEWKNFINYMDIRLYKLNEKMKDIFIPFTVNDNMKKLIQIGLIIEWEANLCWCQHSNRKRLRKSNNITRYEIRNLIYKYSGQNNNNSSIYLYEAIINWNILENNKVYNKVGYIC